MKEQSPFRATARAGAQRGEAAVTPALAGTAQEDPAVTIQISTRAMTSDVSPEYAIRVAGKSGAWRLSWLPELRLTGEQARAGMELDEILSDPDMVYEETAHLRAAVRARRLGIPVEHAVIVLVQRMNERMERADAVEWDAEPEPAGPHPRTGGRQDWVPATSGARSRHRWG
ncbi:hypothetical protein ACIP5Y_19950 [Nocardia sp. NPDC088792]|uniref:hypothetical protein n=1 Tax=Nocardia sp. NPDC088792 TaxID=3364332 RepID=UPI00380CF188